MAANRLLVHAAAHPLRLAASDFYVEAGSTIDEILREVQPKDSLRQRARVFIGRDEIPMQFWGAVRPKHNAVLTVRVLPGKGKKNPLGTILSIAVMIAAPYAGAAFGTSLGLAVTGSGVLTAAQTSFFTAVVSGMVSVAGNLLISAIAPPAKPKSQSLSFSNSQDSAALNIAGARNEMRPYAPVKRVLGFYRVYADLVANTYTEFKDNDQYVRQLFGFGYGPLELSDRKIGETPLSSFTGVEIQTNLGPDPDVAPAFTLFPKDPVQTDLSIALTNAAGWQRQTTGVGVVEISCDVVFPNGLYYIDEQGRRQALAVQLEFRRSPKGANTWTTFETMTVVSSSNAAVRRTAVTKVPAGEYDVEVRRVSADQTEDRFTDKCHFSAFRYFQTGAPVLHKGTVAEALYMKATDQLNGAVDRYNAMAKTVCLDWDKVAGVWVERATNNPASLYRHVLQDRANKKAVPDAKIDLLMLQDWHEFCELKGYTFNAVYDFETTIGDVLDDICAAGRAKRHRLDGLYTVVIDRAQTVAVQHITPRNSWGYRFEVAYPDQPHGWRVPFINELKGYASDERYVYDDGYDETNATKFEQIEFFGVTHPDLIWKQGREHIATPRLRPFRHYFNCDAEILTANKGQMIRFSHDVVLVGLGSARIRSLILDDLDPTKIAGLRLDDVVDMAAGKVYGVRIRHAAGGESIHNLLTMEGEAFEVIFETPVDIDGGPKEDDLVQYGERGKETIDLIISRITFSSDLTAQVECVDAAPAIFLASEGPIPDYVSNVTIPPDLERPVAPQMLSLQSDESVMVVNPDGSVTSRMIINLRNKNAGLIEPVVKARRTGESQFFEVPLALASPSQVIITSLEDVMHYDLRIFYRRPMASLTSVNTLSLPLVLNNVSFDGGGGAPDDVENFRVAVVGNIAILSWAAVSNVDLSHYEIKFTPLFSGVTWGGSQDLEMRATGTSLTTPLRIGTYLIRAVDRSGNASEVFSFVSTGTAAIESLNVVETLQESPDFAGAKTNMVLDGTLLKMEDPALLTGVYALSEVIDLGAVYTSRLSVLLEAAASTESDVMSTWIRLSDVTRLSSVDPAAWQMKLQVSVTSDDTTDSPVWGPWADYVAGDYTFRGVRFQLLVETRDPNVIPFVAQLAVEIDMPDRIEGDDDITVPAAGLDVVINPPFKKKKAINITPQDMLSGDRYELTDQSESGFKVRFYNSSNTPVERTIDWIAKGYGRSL